MIPIRDGCFGMARRSLWPPFPALKPLAALLALAALGGLPLSGQEGGEPQVLEPVVRESSIRRISPDEAVSLAIQNNLSLEVSQVGVETKKRKSDLSWNQFIPSVEVRGSLVLDNEKSKAAGMQPVDLSILGSQINMPIPPDTIYGVVPYSVDAPQWHIAGSLNVSLSLSVAMFANIRRLRLDYENGLLGYEKAKAQIERDIRKDYYNMLLIQENIALLRENYEAAGRRVETARANYRAGLAPELTLLQAQVSQENLKPNMDQAENGLKLSMARFAMNLGLPYNTPFELIPLAGGVSFIPLDMAALISQAASGKPDIQELRQNILLLEIARKAQFYSVFTPYLNLAWSAGANFTRDPWKDDWGNKDHWAKNGSLTLTLGMRLHSLLPWSPDFQGVKDLDDNRRTMDINLSQSIRGTEIEIYNTVLSLEKTQSTAEAQARTIDLAERSYRLTEEAYRAGLQDLLEVQNAELSLRQARVQMLEQQFNYLNGLIDLEYAIGAPFGTLSGAAATRSE